MKRFVKLAFLKALAITVALNLISIVCGLITQNLYEVSLVVEVIFFLVLFVIELLEYLWKNRKM